MILDEIPRNEFIKPSSFSKLFCVYLHPNLFIIMLNELNYTGLGIGLVTFLIIGLFHPLVIKGEYYFGVKCWWVFCLCGIITTFLSLISNNSTISTLLGVFAFSCFWSIKEVFDQRKRVERGWFPKREKKI